MTDRPSATPDPTSHGTAHATAHGTAYAAAPPGHALRVASAWPGLLDAEPHRPTDLRTDAAHPARLYNYLLGGKDHFAADRSAADYLLAADPTIRHTARRNRDFLRRAVQALAATGTDQFLDVGAGIPAPGSTHEVARRTQPQARVVYVDNDPMAVAHIRALSGGSAPVPAPPLASRTPRALLADLRDPGAVLSAPEVREYLDFDRPIALLLVAVLHFLPDSADPYGAVAELVGALPSGSTVVITHGTGDFYTEEDRARLAAAHRHSGAPAVTPRSGAEVLRFVEGLDLLPPGLVCAETWRPDVPRRVSTAPRIPLYALAARKP